MGLSFTSTLFLFVICVCVGIVLGSLFGSRKAPKASATPATKADAEKGNLSRDGEVEILRAWRTASGQVWLDIDGTRLDKKEALQPEQRRRLLNLVVDLRPWLDTPVTQAAQVPAPVAPVASPRPEVQPGPMPAPVAPPQMINQPVTDNVRPVVNLKSIVGQIDDVLQAKLPDSPFKDRDIRMLDGANGTVIVQVDRNKYEGIDAVPDPGIQAFIRQAVAFWEKTSK
jgi:hypothetical protein